MVKIVYESLEAFEANRVNEIGPAAMAVAHKAVMNPDNFRDNTRDKKSIITRLFAHYLSKFLNKPIVLRNKSRDPNEQIIIKILGPKVDGDNPQIGSPDFAQSPYLNFDVEVTYESTAFDRWFGPTEKVKPTLSINVRDGKFSLGNTRVDLNHEWYFDKAAVFNSLFKSCAGLYNAIKSK